MKRTILISVICLIVVMAESNGQGHSIDDELIKVDITKSYSAKKELILQDFMDVEYIVLETNDDFLHQGNVMDVGKKFILVTNFNDDGDIFVYDRSGKALRKINHMGQNYSQQYSQILEITLDEDNQEMFVHDHALKIVLVYDLNGKFKRNFKCKNDQHYKAMYNYDKNNLICYCDNFGRTRSEFVLVSKKDGRITHEMKIPFENHISPVYRTSSKPVTTTVNHGNGLSTATSSAIFSASVPRYRTIIPFKGNCTLIELSSDTVYTFFPDYTLRPCFVRTPPINSMNTKVFLVLNFLSDRYCFLSTLNYEPGFPQTPFLYDSQSKAFFNYSLYNGDYSTKKEINFDALEPVNHEVSCQRLEAFQLVEDLKKGNLKDGKLKEIASKLDEEDNCVIMLVKHRK